MDWLLVISLGLGAYLVGSLPTAFLLVYLLTSKDIRRFGTGNVGALNVYHQVGAPGAAVVWLLDVGKGAVALLAPGWLGAPDWVIFLTAPLVIVGHNWPVFLKFSGGRGAASSFGVSLALVPALALITIGLMVVISSFTRNVVLGAASGFVVLIALLLVTHQGTEKLVVCLLLTLVVAVNFLLGRRGRAQNPMEAVHQ